MTTHELANGLDAAQVKARCAIARPRLEALGVDFDRTGPVLEAVRCAVRDGMLDYVLITAEKPCD